MILDAISTMYNLDNYIPSLYNIRIFLWINKNWFFTGANSVKNLLWLLVVL